MKFSMNTYLDNVYKPIQFQGNGSHGFLCMILLVPVGLDSWNIAQTWPVAALSLEQGLTILFPILLR